MRKVLIWIAFFSLVSFSVVAGTGAEVKGAKKILAFHTMFGVDGLFVGEANPVRDIVGDDLPWEVAKFARGKLDTKGHLEILVKGLVFKDDPSVPVELRGINDESEFRGLVSCPTEENGSVVIKNVITEGFPANVSGDSFINTDIELPAPCVAPVIMILAGSEDKWFAMTGFEGEED